MTIKIDTRENQSKITDIISKDPVLWNRLEEFTFEKMDLGDFYIECADGSTEIIERKNLGTDFGASVYDHSSGNGTFHSKLTRMGVLADRRGVLIEGRYQRGDDGMLYVFKGKNMEKSIPYRTFKNFITHRQREGCILYYTNDLRETLYQLLLINDDKDGPGPALKVDKWEQFLMLLPGIGRDGCKKLRKKYSNPIEAFAHISEWPRLKIVLDRW